MATPRTDPYAAPAPRPARAGIADLAKMRAAGTRIAMLTAYDASLAGVAERAGVDVLLVGDSLGMVVQGHPTTLPVTLEQMLYHVRCVVAGCARPLVVADLPFGTFQGRVDDAYAAGVAALQAGAQMVKVEGGAWMAPAVEYLVRRGVPVCGHVGLTPQSVHTLGGFRVQGRTDAAAEAVLGDAKALVAAGCALLVVECVPRALGAAVTAAAGVPVIGIGAGPECSGQVLVVYDALGIQPGKPARFVRNFMTGHEAIEAALRAYVDAVRDGSFPAPEHCF